MAIIACVDMDAFFASVEQRDNPELIGKPIAVTGAGERTVITTSSYEARAYKVKTGMTVYQAKKLCPQIIFVVGDNKKYARICAMLEEICRRFTPDVEIYSIDEAFLDITGSHHLFGDPESLARMLKDTVKNELKLTCTVGLGPNILIAKLASDLAKPDGLRWIKEDEAAYFIASLPVRKLWGIGSHTADKLKQMGIDTCGQLAEAPLPLLVKHFGASGDRLKAMGSGRLNRSLEVKDQDPKSIGHSITLSEDIWQKKEILSCLLRLSERVGQRARKHDYKGRKVTLTVRYSDFKTFSKQATLASYTNDTSEIYRCAASLLEGISIKKTIRLLGISLSALSKKEGQMLLFQKEDTGKKAALSKAVDAVNERFGEHTVTFASTINEEKGQRVISPSWRPSGARNSDV